MRRVLVVDDDKESIETLTQYISPEGNIVQSATDGDSALHRLRAWKPHLVILDIDPVKMRGLDLIPKIRALTHEEYTAVIFVSSHMSIDEIVKGIDSGADDYLTKPYRQQDVATRMRCMLRLKETQDSLKRACSRIEDLISNDDLTGLMNMRAAYKRGEEEIIRSRRFRKPISSLLLNLDNFSQVNQSYGFLAGSSILQEVAVRIKECLRAQDVAARVGADEFFILLSDTDLANAEFMAERLRDSIQFNPFKSERHMIKLTATLGVAGLTHDQMNQKMVDLFHITAEALRSAKANGSNRIEVYSFS